jgi:NitT/TauT family transport system permease protein
LLAGKRAEKITKTPVEALLFLNNKLMSVYMLILFIALWQAAPALGWVNPVFIPAFSTVLRGAVEMKAGTLLLHIGTSLWRIVTGMLFCMALALPFGFILGGALPKTATALRALMNFLAQIPPYILYAVVVIAAGPGETAIAFVIVWSAFWPVLFTVIEGVKEIDPRLIRCAKAMNAHTVQIFFKVVFPAAFPNLMRGLRQGLTLGFIMLIGAESMGAKSGIGFLIHNAQVMGHISRIYLGALLSAVLGFLLNFATGRIEKKLVVRKEEENEKAPA